MKPPAFDYLRAETVGDVLEGLAQEGGNARVLAGGQSLMAMLNMRLAKPKLLIDIMRLKELRKIEQQQDTVVIGAGVRQADLLAWPDLAEALPLVALALPWVGHMQTRSRGTICGSLAHADPSAEMPLTLVALGGEVFLRSVKRRRRVAAKEFFAGTMLTARADDELIEGISLPIVRDGRFAFREVARRHGDFAIVACAAMRTSAGVRLAVGGVADRCARRRSRHRALPPRPRAHDRPRTDRRGAAMTRLKADARHSIRFTLNDKPVEAEAEPRMLLSDYLRHQLGATGTHVGCEHGVCGACTIVVDGMLTRSCLTLAAQVEGCDIKTVEGLAPSADRLCVLQRAFRRNHALQCGFCTAGILMSLDHFLSRNPAPTEAEIRDLLSGHLCRCTGYTPIIQAALEAAAQLASATEETSDA